MYIKKPLKEAEAVGGRRKYMALLTCNFESGYLKGNTEIYVILPDWDKRSAPEDFYAERKTYRVLWLLHGGGGDASDWIRKSKVELYACENDLVVVTFSGCNAMYTNWQTFANGMDYEGFFFEELIPLVSGWFPVSQKREDHFIAGLSMGGAGALKFAVMHPELFAKCACLSSSGKKFDLDYVDDGDRSNPVQAQPKNAIANAGGMEGFYYSADNIRYRLEMLARENRLSELPELFLSCGEADHHFGEFRDFLNYAKQTGVSLTSESIPGYQHEWRFWDLALQHALHFFGMHTRQ